MEKISRDEWLIALKDAGVGLQVSDPDSLTVNEFMEMTGLKREAAVRRLAILVETGAAEKTTKHIIVGGGRGMYMQSYKLKVLTKPTKKK